MKLAFLFYTDVIIKKAQNTLYNVVSMFFTTLFSIDNHLQLVSTPIDYTNLNMSTCFRKYWLQKHFLVFDRFSVYRFYVQKGLYSKLIYKLSCICFTLWINPEALIRTFRHSQLFVYTQPCTLLTTK